LHAVAVVTFHNKRNNGTGISCSGCNVWRNRKCENNHDSRNLWRDINSRS